MALHEIIRNDSFKAFVIISTYNDYKKTIIIYSYTNHQFLWYLNNNINVRSYILTINHKNMQFIS